MNPSEISSNRKHIISESVSEFTKTEATINRLLYPHNSFFAINPLIEYTFKRGLISIRLAKQGHIDDAEIIFRSMLEGFIKIIYILTAENDEIHKQRLTGYFGTLRQIETLRTSEKYKILSEAKINNNLNPYTALILSKEEEESLKQEPSWSNRKYRQEVKAKWSYSELSKYLKTNLQGGIFVPFELLDHYYKTSSHIAHGDELLFRNLWANDFLEKHYKQLVKLGRMTKLLRIINELAFWIYLELAKFLQQENAYDNAYDRYSRYMDDIGNLHQSIVEKVHYYGKR